MRHIRMIKGASILADKCANLQDGEKTLIVADTNNFDIAEILATSLFERDFDVVTTFMTPQGAHGQDPPKMIVASMMEADVVFEPTTYSLTRAEASEQAKDNDAKIVSMPDYTGDMLVSGGLEADFPAHEETVEKLAGMFTEAKYAELTAPVGTNISMELGSREGNSGKGFCPGPGTICSPPNIEANISPLEETAQGNVAVDVSIPDPHIGIVNRPVELTVEEGFVTQIEGGREAKVLKSLMEKQEDEKVYNIAELGIGLNPNAEISGVMLEDEGALGTAHIGLGDNHTSGGYVKAPLHLDMVINNPTLELDGKTVIRESELLFI